MTALKPPVNTRDHIQGKYTAPLDATEILGHA